MLPNLQRDKATFDTIHAKLCRLLVYRERCDVFGKPRHVAGMLFVGIWRPQARKTVSQPTVSRPWVPRDHSLLFDSHTHINLSLQCEANVTRLSVFSHHQIHLICIVETIWSFWSKGPNCHVAKRNFICWWECFNTHEQMYHLWHKSSLQPLL